MKSPYDVNHPVAVAVEPQRQDAIKRSEEAAAGIIDRIRSDMDAVDWNLDKAAPYPKDCYQNDYKQAKEKYSLYMALTCPSGGKGRSECKEMNAKLTGQFIAEAKENASFQYDAFICKLIEKIGCCESAELSGSHVWGYSFLAVTKEGGLLETWKTQQIVNVSKLGKLFNQFPTRKVKAA